MYKLFWTDVKFLTIQMLVWLNKSKINKDLWDFLKYHSVPTVNIVGVEWVEERACFVNMMMLYFQNTNSSGT